MSKDTDGRAPSSPQLSHCSSTCQHPKPAHPRSDHFTSFNSETRRRHVAELRSKAPRATLKLFPSDCLYAKGTVNRQPSLRAEDS